MTPQPEPNLIEKPPESVADWNAVRRQAVFNAMQLVNNTLVQLHVTLATGIANQDFPDEFRNHIKQQLLQIAATVEVPNDLPNR